MSDDVLLVVTAADVASLLDGEDATIMALVAAAYASHGAGRSVVPHSAFLRFPARRDRIIALPAYLGGAFEVAGLKWIASFPDNVERGLERASGLVVLNSLATGQPRAIVEGALLSAKRTAASAAVAALALHAGPAPHTIGMLGCGRINFETLRFLRHVWPCLQHVRVCDLSATRAETFAAHGREAFAEVSFEAVSDWRLLVEGCALVSIATTAMTPHIDDLGDGPLRTVLHLSLRDLTPRVVLAADNVVDDVEHVCRAETSLHLAERSSGHRRFIRCALSDVLAGTHAPKWDYESRTIFSPFGLGILDIAVANFVCDRAEACGRGIRIPFARRAP